MNSKLQFSTFFGITFALLILITAIASGQGDENAFIDLKSILIVLFGTFFVVSACFSFSDVVKSFAVVSKTIFYGKPNFKIAAEKCLYISEIAKKTGLLKLDSYSDEYPTELFFRKNIELAIDGVKASELEVLMENEINSISSRNSKTIEILKKASEIAPAMGLIGTLIGLVQMLGNLDDPSKIGPAMAVALLTTMYGAILAYMVFLPLSTCLEKNSKQEIDLYIIYGESIISIAKNEGPIKLELKLNSSLPPGSRIKNYS